ncbi:MAG: SGNH/GDSL hydrolase family protein [Pyrinomonadaceae bacterium]|nr:SGNH/GDSL hydrolase family protein [Pyrinomonadaceae bacterium]
MRNGSSFRNGTGKTRLAAKLLTILLGLGVGLLLAEVTLRLIGFRYLNLYQEDQYVGFALRPGAEGWWTKEGETYVKISSDGMRDREHSKVKPADTLRIAVLGDSFAEALQVPVEMAFWAVAEQRLQGCKAFAGQKIEVINFGVSGFSTGRELLTLRQRVWQYSPDVVVLVVTTSNDIRDNSLALDQEYAGLALPYFVHKDGALVLEESLLKARNESFKSHLMKSFLGRSLNWLRDRIRLIGLIDRSREAFHNYRERKNTPRSIGDEPGLSAKVYVEPGDPVWAEAWRITDGLILLMRDEVKAHGAQFLIVTGSSSIQAYPNPAVRLDFMRSLGIGDLFYPDRRIKALGEREGIEVLNVALMLQEYADQNRAFLHGTNGVGHWNALGHRLVGNRVSEKLCEIASTKR